MNVSFSSDSDVHFLQVCFVCSRKKKRKKEKENCLGVTPLPFSHTHANRHVQHNDDEGAGASNDHRTFPLPQLSLLKRATWELNLPVCVCACDWNMRRKPALMDAAPDRSV